MEIDEQLFEAYSPKQLKDALDHAAEIELPPFRPTWGAAALAPIWKLLATSLLGPMMKLVLALVMIAVFAATTIAPQVQLAREAATVLCGTRSRTPLSANAPPRVRRILTPRRAGGAQSWAYDKDKVGKPAWIDLSKEVGDWAQAAKKESPDIEWALPEDAKTDSFNARFVDAMLRVGAGNAGLADKLMTRPVMSESGTLNRWESGASPNRLLLRSIALATPECSDLKLATSNFLSVCLVPMTFELLARKLRDATSRSMPELASEWFARFVGDGNPKDYRVSSLQCVDFLEGGEVRGLLPAFSVAYIFQLMEALPKNSALPRNSSCGEDCPLESPLCKNGSCIKPTCSDFMPLCNDDRDIGFLVRRLCSVTCGCRDPWRRALYFVTEKDGCHKPCVEEAASLESGPGDCRDVTESCRHGSPTSTPAPAPTAPNSTPTPAPTSTPTPAKCDTDLAELVAFATSPAVASSNEYWNFVVPNAEAWKEMGCSALYFDLGTSKGFQKCGDGLKVEADGKKSFKWLCPMTCRLGLYYTLQNPSLSPTAAPTLCTDDPTYADSCAVGAAAGECDRAGVNALFMRANCAASCGKCSLSTPPTLAPPPVNPLDLRFCDSFPYPPPIDFSDKALELANYLIKEKTVVLNETVGAVLQFSSGDPLLPATCKGLDKPACRGLATAARDFANKKFATPFVRLADWSTKLALRYIVPCQATCNALGCDFSTFPPC
jgi:hypothetical protein